LNLEQCKLFSEIIEEEQTNTLSIDGSLRNFTRDTKSEPDQLLFSSPPQSSSYEEAKPQFRTFDNPLFLETSSHLNS